MTTTATATPVRSSRGPNGDDLPTEWPYELSPGRDAVPDRTWSRIAAARVVSCAPVELLADGVDLVGVMDGDTVLDLREREMRGTIMWRAERRGDAMRMR